jgi:arabinose-5-phosphate isomerase
MINTIQDIINREANAIKNIGSDESFEKAVNLIHQQVHLNNGKVVISGMGKAGQIGVNIATTLSSTGTPAVFLHPSESQHGDLGIVQKNDILILISNSGKTREIVELEVLVKRLYSDIKIIGLTGNLEGDLAQSSDVVLYTGAPKEVCPLGLTPTTSTTAMTVIGDVIIVLLMQKIGFTKEEYAKRHHSGYLGSKARGENQILS